MGGREVVGGWIFGVIRDSPVRNWTSVRWEQPWRIFRPLSSHVQHHLDPPGWSQPAQTEPACPKPNYPPPPPVRPD